MWDLDLIEFWKRKSAHAFLQCRIVAGGIIPDKRHTLHLGAAVGQHADRLAVRIGETNRQPLRLDVRTPQSFHRRRSAGDR